MGGKVPATIETGLAVRAAQTRDEVARAVDAALGGGAKVARALESPAARVAPTVARAVMGSKRQPAPAPMETLSTPLYPGEMIAKKPADVHEAAAMRAQELAQAVANPDAVARAVRAAVPAANPTVLDAIVQTVQRKLTYLQGKAPAIAPPDPMRQKPLPVSQAEAARFARIVGYAEDPVSILHDMANGRLTADGADVLRNVYPRLFGEVQKRIIDQASKPGNAVPYRTRIQLSMLTGADLDPGMRSLGTIQQGLPSMPPLGGMGGPGGQQQMPQPPGVAPNISGAYETGADKRAAK
jgi:hypothetical protein